MRVAIEALGFRRNDSARLLRTGQAETVGFVLEDIGDPFYSALARGAESVARAQYQLRNPNTARLNGNAAHARTSWVSVNAASMSRICDGSSSPAATSACSA